MTKYLSFDLEIAALIPDDAQDWKQYRPLGITCAAVAWAKDNGNGKTLCFHGENDDFRPMPRLRQGECVDLVWTLQAHVLDGYTLLTHNGVSFDFDVLAEESGMHSECVELAMGSVDTCLQIHCIKGFPVGIDAIARGMGIQGKIEGMDGAKAPQMWAEGKYDEVLAYVAQDARCTLEVALAIEKRRELRWISQKGRLNGTPIPCLLTAREALQLPEPNVKWMKEGAIPRSRFTEWMNKSPG